jgi:hypothetical protein
MVQQPLVRQGILIPLGHTTVGKTPLDGWSAWQHTPLKSDRYFIPPAGFELAYISKPAIADPRLQSARPLESANNLIIYDYLVTRLVVQLWHKMVVWSDGNELEWSRIRRGLIWKNIRKISCTN